jgi:NTE family protein
MIPGSDAAFSLFSRLVLNFCMHHSKNQRSRPASAIFLLVLCFFVKVDVKAQKQYTNLVLEGAGVRGIAYAGAIRFLEEEHMIDSMGRVGGTSAGAIAALAISLGYSSSEIESLIFKTRLQKFNDGPFFFVGGMSRLNRHYGWYRGRAFMKWLEKMIEAKTANKDITFQELHDRKFKDLYVTGTSLNHQKMLVFSRHSYPAMKVKDAVRISMSIPLYFEAVIIDSLGRVLNRKETSRYHDIMVDGGFTGNFPITIFDSITYNHGIEKRTANRATLGMRIDTPEQIRYDAQHYGLAPVPISRFRDYASAFYNYMIENLNRASLTEDDWSRTVSISSGTIGPKIRKLSVDEKDQLINNGYRAMKQFMTGN